MTLQNAGPGKAYALQVSAQLLQAVTGLSLAANVKELPVLPPGKLVIFSFALSATERLPDGKCTVRLSVSERFNNVPAPKELTIETRGLVPPDLQITDIGLDDDDQGDSYGNSNGRIEKGESVEVEAIVQNRGQGEAGAVKVQIQAASPDLIFLSKQDFALGDLPPGEFRKIKFAFTVPPNYSGAMRLPLAVQITEARGRYGKTVPLVLELNQIIQSTSELAAEKVVLTGRNRTTVDIPAAPTLTADVDVNIPVSQSQRPDAIAVIIGNRDYSGNDIPKVDYAIHDAAVIKEYVIKTMGYLPGNILYTENATKANFEGFFGTETDYRGRLFNLIKPGKSEVFIYYSGHGAPDPDSRQGYFVPVDCDPSLVRLNGYSLNTFYANLAKLQTAGLTVVIDACFSGVSEGGSLLKKISPVLIAIENPALTIPNATVFTSAAGDQVSTWYGEKKHSLFTYFFLKGLAGGADRDSNRVVTMQELEDYVSDANDGVPYWARRLQNRDQKPTVVGEKNKVMVKY